MAPEFVSKYWKLELLSPINTWRDKQNKMLWKDKSNMQLAQKIKKAVIISHQLSTVGVMGLCEIALVPKYQTMRSYY
jgi:hypothetical protein